MIRRLRERLSVYPDLRDWWIGVYRGDTHVYVCPLPCLVFRWQRAGVWGVQWNSSGIFTLTPPKEDPWPGRS